MFDFKEFSLTDARCGMKIGTDGVLLGAWVDIKGIRSVVDAGAGCGLISLMIAQRTPVADITAVEIESDAAADCRENFMLSPWRDRLSVVEADFNLFSSDKGVDLIVSNPPYFTDGGRAPLKKRACARHEDSLGIKSLVHRASDMLSDNGRLAVICPSEKEECLIYEAEMSRMKLRRICHVHTVEGKPSTRIMCEFARNDGPLSTNSVTIRDSKGEYTSGFKSLTRDFYLAF